MKRLILTSSSGLPLGRADRAEVTIPFAFNFAWGELPSSKKLAFYLAARSGLHVRGEHWSDYAGKRRHDCKDPSLIEYCEVSRLVQYPP